MQDLHFRLRLTVVWCSHLLVLSRADWSYLHPGPVFWISADDLQSQFQMFLTFPKRLVLVKIIFSSDARRTPYKGVRTCWEFIRRDRELNCVDISSRSFL